MNERINLYSSCLYAVSVEENCERDVYESLCLLTDILSENKDYVKLMSSTAISQNEKEALLDKAFSQSLHPFVLNFMKILCKKRIFGIVPSVAREYEKTYFNENNIAKAKITTAIELRDEKKQEVAGKISKAIGKEIIPEFFVDENILGGILVETENAGIDASLTGRLESIKRFIGKN